MKTLAKRNYLHPAIEIVKLEYGCQLLQASQEIGARQVSNERRNEDYDD